MAAVAIAIAVVVAVVVVVFVLVLVLVLVPVLGDHTLFEKYIACVCRRSKRKKQPFLTYIHPGSICIFCFIIDSEKTCSMPSLLETSTRSASLLLTDRNTTPLSF